MCIKVNQLDALQTLVNAGITQAADVLNEILDIGIDLQVAQVEILSLQQANHTLEQQIGLMDVSAMRLPFTGTLVGNALLVFPIDSATQLVATLMHEETDLPDLNAIKRGTLSEVGNIILNGVMFTVSDGLKQSLRYAIPFYFEGTVTQLLSETELFQTEQSEIEAKDGSTILLVQTRLTCDLFQLTGDIVLVFTVHSFNTLLLTL